MMGFIQLDEREMNMNAREALNNTVELIQYMELFKTQHGYSKKVPISEVCEDLGIFDWWNEYISVSQLNQMKKFLEKAIDLGYEGYVCFKVGAAGCSHGMWAHKNESTTGYSPDGACLYHSFRGGDNYWDVRFDNGEWYGAGKKIYRFTLKQIQEVI